MLVPLLPLLRGVYVCDAACGGYAVGQPGCGGCGPGGQDWNAIFHEKEA